MNTARLSLLAVVFAAACQVPATASYRDPLGLRPSWSSPSTSEPSSLERESRTASRALVAPFAGKRSLASFSAFYGAAALAAQPAFETANSRCDLVASLDPPYRSVSVPTPLDRGPPRLS